MVDKKIQKTIDRYCEKYGITEEQFLEKASLHLIALTLYLPDAMDIIRRVEKAVVDRNNGN